MYYFYFKTHRLQLSLLTVLISVFLISCSDSSITDSDNGTVITPEIMGTWNPITVDNIVDHYESFSLQKDQGIHEVINESNQTTLYRLFEWEEKVPGKFIEITLLRYIENGVEEYVHGNKELIDIGLKDDHLTMYGKRWLKKKVD